MNNPIIILDFDGTIADTQSLIIRTMQQTIEHLGLPQRTNGECAAMIGLPLKETFTRLIPMDDETGDRCVDTYAEFFNQNNQPGTVPLFPDVKETLEGLHRNGATLTIATSRHRASLMAFLNEMNMESLISYIVCGNDVNHPKPAPDMVEKTLETLGTSKENVFVVGDAVYDIGMGRNAGVRTVGVTYGNGKRNELEEAGADHLIDGFAELAAIVENFSRPISSL